jgi:hypothetical protein
MYDETAVFRPAAVTAPAGALTSTSTLRDEVDRLEHTIERFLDRLTPILKAETERPTANPDSAAKRADSDSELTSQLNGLAGRLQVNTERLQRFIDRVDL